MQNIKYISKSISYNGIIAAGTLDEIALELPSEYSKVEGIAFYEDKNANGLDYDLKVADESGIHQDYSPRLDFLSVVNGVNFMNIGFDQRYKPFAMNSKGNTLKLGVTLKEGVGAGQLIRLKIVVKCVN